MCFFQSEQEDPLRNKSRWMKTITHGNVQNFFHLCGFINPSIGVGTVYLCVGLWGTCMNYLVKLQQYMFSHITEWNANAHIRAFHILSTWLPWWPDQCKSLTASSSRTTNQRDLQRESVNNKRTCHLLIVNFSVISSRFSKVVFAILLFLTFVTLASAVQVHPFFFKSRNLESYQTVAHTNLYKL